MLCVGMDPTSIRSGAMSLVFNDYVNEADQRKVCKEYELTMDEDLRRKFEIWKEGEEEHERMLARIQTEEEEWSEDGWFGENTRKPDTLWDRGGRRGVLTGSTTREEH